MIAKFLIFLSGLIILIYAFLTEDIILIKMIGIFFIGMGLMGMAQSFDNYFEKKLIK